MGYEYVVSGTIVPGGNKRAGDEFERDLGDCFDDWVAASGINERLIYDVSSYDTYMFDRIDDFYKKHWKEIDELEIYMQGDVGEDFTKIVNDGDHLLMYAGMVFYGDESLEDIYNFFGIRLKTVNVDHDKLKELI